MPNASWSWMTGAGEKATPADAAEGGCVWITIATATAGLTVNTLLTAFVSPVALAVSLLLVPATSIRKFVNTAVPLPAAVPRSNVVVPCRGPVPPVSVRLTFRLLGKPEIELFPN